MKQPLLLPRSVSALNAPPLLIHSRLFTMVLVWLPEEVRNLLDLFQVPGNGSLQSNRSLLNQCKQHRQYLRHQIPTRHELFPTKSKEVGDDESSLYRLFSEVK